MENLVPISLYSQPNAYTFSRHHKETVYEWYYVEIFHEDSHVVMIFSLKDPFLKNNPGSIYCTWYSKDQLESYSYVQVSQEEHADFSGTVTDFFERKSDKLTFYISCHSLSFGLSLKLSHDLKSSNSDENEQSASDDRIFQKGNTSSHFWQPLIHGNGISLVAEKTAHNGSNRASRFFDVPLAKKLILQNRNSDNLKRKIFSRDAICYVDHNAGFEPLERLRNPWFWWHCHDGDKGEIGYFFPHLNTGHALQSEQNNPPIQDQEFVSALKDIRFVEKITGFGVLYPLRIKNWKVSKIIESAPFYMRGALESDGKEDMDSQLQLSAKRVYGTVESLSPQLVGGRFNQALMKARLAMGSVLTPRVSLEFLEICKAVTQINGKSFYLASLVLPIETRNHAYVTYTFCRMIDDATDDEIVRARFGGSKIIGEMLHFVFSTTTQSSLELSEALKGFLIWFLDHNHCNAVESTADSFAYDLKVFAATFKWEKAPFDALLQGQQEDEEFEQPKTSDDFMHYCYLVAGVVGILMAKAFGAPQSSLPQAVALGNAMQITNILRDVREDCLELNRVYLPVSLFKFDQKSLRQFLETGSQDSEFLKVWHFAFTKLGAQACELYAQALVASQSIPSWPARLCVRLMIGIYGAILGKLLEDPFIAIRQRVVIPFRRKVWIFVCILLRRSPVKCAGLHSSARLSKLKLSLD
jgi:phytoene/squalene synthetase